MICRYVQCQLGGEAHLRACWLDENLVLKAPNKTLQQSYVYECRSTTAKIIQDNALSYDRLLMDNVHSTDSHRIKYLYRVCFMKEFVASKR